MIDTKFERLILYVELLRMKLQKMPSSATRWRWRTAGVRGYAIETVAIGGSVYSSEEAFQRWVEKIGGLNAASEAPAPLPDDRKKATTKRRLEAADRKAAELLSAGKSGRLAKRAAAV